MVTEQELEALSRLLDGELSSEETRAMRKALAQREELREALAKLESHNSGLQALVMDAISDEEANGLVQGALARARPAPLPRRSFGPAAWAGPALAAGLAAGFFWASFHHRPATQPALPSSIAKTMSQPPAELLAPAPHLAFLPGEDPVYVMGHAALIEEIFRLRRVAAQCQPSSK